MCITCYIPVESWYADIFKLSQVCQKLCDEVSVAVRNNKVSVVMFNF